MAGNAYEIYHFGYTIKISKDSGSRFYLTTVDQNNYESIKYELNIPALNYKYGNSSTIQPASIYTLIIIKA